MNAFYNGTTMSGSVEVRIFDDDILELIESFTVRVMEGLSENVVVFGTGRQTIEIQDNEGPGELTVTLGLYNVITMQSVLSLKSIHIIVIKKRSLETMRLVCRC